MKYLILISKGLKRTSNLLDSNLLRDFNADIECEQPNQHLYEFAGNLKIYGEGFVLCLFFFCLI